ncbi:MAG: hypothetical protein ACQKBT_02760 [Puniceicoccales bacterium]
MKPTPVICFTRRLIPRGLWIFFLLALGTLSNVQGAEDLPEFQGIPRFSLKEDGEVQIAGLRFSAGFIDTNWKFQGQGNRTVEVEPGYPRKKGSWWIWREKLIPEEESSVVLEQQIHPQGDSAFDLQYQLTGDEILVNETCLRILVPIKDVSGDIIHIDRDRIEMPEEFGIGRIFHADVGDHRLVIPVAKGELEIEGEFSVLIQDLRKWGNNYYYQIRLTFSPNVQVLDEDELELEVAYRAE